MAAFNSAWLGHAQTLVLQMFVLLFCFKQSVQRQSQKFSLRLERSIVDSIELDPARDSFLFGPS